MCIDSNFNRPLGAVYLKWKIAVAKYSVDYSLREPLDAFDKVICGLLDKVGGRMDKEKLGTLMGLNMRENHECHMYRDKSECEILDKAIKHLADYELVDETNGVLSLNVVGQTAIDDGFKRRKCNGNAIVYLDLSFGLHSIAKEVCNHEGIDLEEDMPVEFDNGVFLRQCIREQNKEIDKAHSIDDIRQNYLEIKEVSVPVNVWYDFKEKTYSFTTDIDSDILDDYINDDEDARAEILKAFFDKTKKATIYKTQAQINFEEARSCNNRVPLFGEECMIGFVPELIQGQAIMFLYVPEMTDRLKATIKEKLDECAPLVFVEFLKGEDQFDNYHYGKFYMKRVAEFTADSPCVCAGEFYLKSNLFVIEYDGDDYQIPMISMYEDKRYRVKALLEPFKDMTYELIDKYKKDISNCSKDNPEISLPVVYKKYRLAISFCSKAGLASDGVKAAMGRWLYDVLIDLKHKNTKVSPEFMKQLGEACSIDKDLKVQWDDLYKSKNPPTPKIITRTYYVLDTNVFIDEPTVLNKFNRVRSVILVAMAVKEELDNISHQDNEKGSRAKEALRILNSTLKDSVGFVRIAELTNEDLNNMLPPGLNRNKTDNHLLVIALKHKIQHPDSPTVIVTSDKNLTANAEECDIKVLTLSDL